MRETARGPRRADELIPQRDAASTSSGRSGDMKNLSAQAVRARLMISKYILLGGDPSSVC
jgi:hypothetical protein